MRKSRRATIPIIVLISLAALGGAASFTVSKLEERDTFCISCHTLPEVAYHERAIRHIGASEAAPDLSTRHYQLDEGVFRCIDCHRGNSTLAHRILAHGIAARDTLIWISGRADPALEKGTATIPLLIDSACARCHEDTLLRQGFENHFHALLPETETLSQDGSEASAGTAAVQLEPPRGEFLDTTVSCMDCHKSHVQIPGAELLGYLDLVGDVYPACEMCHIESGFGPQQLSGPIR